MLQDKTIVVTGGAGVLGRGVAELAVDYGAQVVLLDVIEQPEQTLGQYVQVDLTDQAAVTEVFQRIGPFHGVANVAGGFDMGANVFETDDKLWQTMFDINVTTLRRVLQAAVPLLIDQGGGSIVNIGALGALRGIGQMGAYGAAKSTVMRLTESLSEEVKAQGVNVNAVLPSLIDTPRNRADMPDADFDTWVSPQDLAQVICFLLSYRARAIHGALVPVSGLI